MKVAAFADVHAHADALEAVLAAATDAGAKELWSLGDMVGSGPDPVRAVALVRSHCTVALAGNHDYGATGSIRLAAFGEPGSPGYRSIELAAELLAASSDLAWLRSRKPAARRAGLQCWHASPRNPVSEYVARQTPGRACSASAPRSASSATRTCRARGARGLTGPFNPYGSAPTRAWTSPRASGC